MLSRRLPSESCRRSSRPEALGDPGSTRSLVSSRPERPLITPQPPFPGAAPQRVDGGDQSAATPGLTGRGDHWRIAVSCSLRQSSRSSTVRRSRRCASHSRTEPRRRRARGRVPSSRARFQLVATQNLVPMRSAAIRGGVLVARRSASAFRDKLVVRASRPASTSSSSTCRGRAQELAIAVADVFRTPGARACCRCARPSARVAHEGGGRVLSRAVERPLARVPAAARRASRGRLPLAGSDGSVASGARWWRSPTARRRSWIGE